MNEKLSDEELFGSKKTDFIELDLNKSPNLVFETNEEENKAKETKDFEISKKRKNLEEEEINDFQDVFKFIQKYSGIFKDQIFD